MEDKRKKRSPKVSLPQPPPPPVNPRKLSVLPASKSATFSLGLPQPPSPKPRGKYKRSVGAMGTAKDVLTVPMLPPKPTRFVQGPRSLFNTEKIKIEGWSEYQTIRISFSYMLLTLCSSILMIFMQNGTFRERDRKQSCAIFFTHCNIFMGTTLKSSLAIYSCDIYEWKWNTVQKYHLTTFDCGLNAGCYGDCGHIHIAST